MDLEQMMVDVSKALQIAAEYGFTVYGVDVSPYSVTLRSATPVEDLKRLAKAGVPVVVSDYPAIGRSRQARLVVQRHDGRDIELTACELLDGAR